MKHKFIYLLLSMLILSYHINGSDDYFLNILSTEEEEFFNKRNYNKLLLSLTENIKDNDARNFYTGYLLYQRGKYSDAFSYFKNIKDYNLGAFANYYVGRYYINHSKFKEVGDAFSKIEQKHYFENTVLITLAKIYFRRMDLENFTKIYEQLFPITKKKQKLEIQKLYIDLLYRVYTKKKKENIITKEKLKKEILVYLDLDSLANTSWLKTYVKKIFRTENDYFNLLLKKYYYLINKFRYVNALNTIDSDINRYSKYQYKAKSKASRKRYLEYKNRLYLLKIEILYKLRRYKNTFPIFDNILKFNKPIYYYWWFQVLYKRNMLKKYEYYYKKNYNTIVYSEFIEEIDYLRAILNFNNHTAETENLFNNFFIKYKISNKIIEMQEKLAWFYYREGIYSKSIILYENMLKNKDGNGHNLANYWLGKIYKNIGLEKEGEKYWEKILIESPLSYYSNLVLNYSDNNFNKFVLSNRKKLNQKLNVKNFDKIINNNKIPNYIRFFIKYRLYNLALYELFYLYKRNNRNIDHNLKLALSKLFYLDEKSEKYAHAIFHRDMGGADYPENDSLEIWQLAFPNMYKDDVKFASKKIKISQSLISAIMREESSFNRLAKSYSNAYGLMQLLYPTARRMRWDLRKYTGLNFTSSWMLFNSRYNISLGTTYLKLLEKEFKGNKISMIASYNAGEKNVAKWRKKYQELSEDEFVESIPINQTKNYVKKVLKAHYIYNYIYDFSNDSNYISLEEINLPNIKNQKKKKGVRAQNIELIQKKEKKSKGSKY